jgi:hypothetical protein
LFAFLGDNYVPKTNFSLQNHIKDKEKSQKAKTKWLRNSGLVVNHSKTDLCLLYKKDFVLVTVSIGQARITFNKQIKAIGLIFYSKLQWTH